MIPGAAVCITELEGVRVAISADDVNNNTNVVPVELVSNGIPPLLLVVAKVLIVMEEVAGTTVLLDSMEYEHKYSQGL